MLERDEWEDMRAQQLALQQLVRAVRGILKAMGHNPDDVLEITEWADPDAVTATPLDQERSKQFFHIQSKANALLAIPDQRLDGAEGPSDPE